MSHARRLRLSETCLIERPASHTTGEATTLAEDVACSYPQRAKSRTWQHDTLTVRHMELELETAVPLEIGYRLVVNGRSYTVEDFDVSRNRHRAIPLVLALVLEAQR